LLIRSCTTNSRLGGAVDRVSSRGVTVNRVGAMFTFFSRPIRDVYIAPSQFEVGFVSTAHSEEDSGKTVEAF
jgi:glutamate-1-semialdehyde aminotransferase